ncbi:MAG: hypothetical protein ACSLE8_15545 [Rhodococcus sp. (in: high G+C Gram-positive bacteria)]
MWDIEVTDEFLEWWHSIEVDRQEALTDSVDLSELRDEGVI